MRPSDWRAAVPTKDAAGPRVLAVVELGLESQGGHRLLSFQVEQTVVRGVDEEADTASAFALHLFAAIDGRPPPDLDRIGGGGRWPVPKPTRATTKTAAKATIGRATTRRSPAAT